MIFQINTSETDETVQIITSGGQKYIVSIKPETISDTNYIYSIKSTLTDPGLSNAQLQALKAAREAQILAETQAILAAEIARRAAFTVKYGVI